MDHRDGLDIQIGVDLKDDFQKFRELLHKVEDMRKLIPEWNELEAEQLHEEILDLASEMLDVHARRSKKNKTPKDSQ